MKEGHLKYTPLSPDERARFNPDGSPNEWYDSAEKKTAEERQAHYTAANFPGKPKYFTTNGGGAGRISPYPKSDPKYAAYE